MLAPYGAAAQGLINAGALPQQVDGALQKFGMAMGPFRMGDLAGLDIGWATRKRKAAETGISKPVVADKLCEAGRYGQKTGAGWYRYEAGKRDPIPDPVTEQLIAEYRTAHGITPRKVTDAEVVERCIYALINEGARILQEGIAARASDIDLVYLNGYGFPRHSGGPMFYADSVGLPNVVRALKSLCRRARRGQVMAAGTAAAATGRAGQVVQLNRPGLALLPTHARTPNTMTDVAIVSTARTGLAKSWKGAFNMTYAPTLAAHSIKHAVQRAGIDPGEVEDVILGASLLEGTTGGNVARIAALRAGLPVTTAGVSINRFCSSGLQAIAMAAQRIIVDQVPVMVAGGVESISCVQNEVNRHMRVDPAMQDIKPEIYWNMLQTAEQVAKRYGISREDQDAYGARSQQRAAAAQAAGKFARRNCADDHHHGRGGQGQWPHRPPRSDDCRRRGHSCRNDAGRRQPYSLGDAGRGDHGG